MMGSLCRDIFACAIGRRRGGSGSFSFVGIVAGCSGDGFGLIYYLEVIRGGLVAVFSGSMDWCGTRVNGTKVEDK